LTEQATSSARTAIVAKQRFDPRRVYVALVFIPVFYFLVRHLPPVALFGVVTVAALLALAEFYNLYFRAARATAATALGLGCGFVVLAVLQWPDVVSDRAVFIGILLAVLTYRLLSPRGIRESLTDAAVLVFGVMYVALTLGHLLLTRALAGGEFLIFFVVLVTWAADTGAYYAGMTLGRHRLAPSISPNKTVEGLAGGTALAVIVAFGARAWFLPSFTALDCVITGVLLSGAGVLGDLAESAMKRSAGVKDSGGLIPAHGGLLDRLDSMLFTAPAFYYYMVLFKMS
jgi:phosphatidate cytidylyltransferase